MGILTKIFANALAHVRSTEYDLVAQRNASAIALEVISKARSAQSTSRFAIKQ